MKPTAGLAFQSQLVPPTRNPPKCHPLLNDGSNEIRILLVLMVARILPKLPERGTGSVLPAEAVAMRVSGFHRGLLFASKPTRVSSYQVGMPMVVRRADPSGPKEIQPRAALQAGS